MHFMIKQKISDKLRMLVVKIKSVAQTDVYEELK